MGSSKPLVTTWNTEELRYHVKAELAQWSVFHFEPKQSSVQPWLADALFGTSVPEFLNIT